MNDNVGEDASDEDRTATDDDVDDVDDQRRCGAALPERIATCEWSSTGLPATVATNGDGVVSVDDGVDDDVGGNVVVGGGGICGCCDEVGWVSDGGRHAAVREASVMLSRLADTTSCSRSAASCDGFNAVVVGGGRGCGCGGFNELCLVGASEAGRWLGCWSCFSVSVQ